MGRRKTYDRDDLIERSMEMFRDHGFAGTSTEMLVEGLGVNRYSLYAEFGSKQGLFDAALQRYDEEVLGRRFGPLEAPGAGVDEVRALLQQPACPQERHGQLRCAPERPSGAAGTASAGPTRCVPDVSGC